MDFKLFAVRVFVTDWDRALRFYSETLGIPVECRSDEHGWAQLATGEGRLAVERVEEGDAEGRSLVGRFVGASLRVPDVRTAYSTLLERGVQFVGAPETQSWGGTLAHLTDPDGNIITLMSGDA